MKTSVVIYCYDGDGELLPYCVESVCHAIPDATVHLIDDSNHPVSADIIGAISEKCTGRVVYKKSTFDRGGNLRGKECILGMLDEMVAACREDNSEVVVKLDCDTLILRAGWLDVFVDSQAGYAGTSRPGTWASGICYMLKRPLLQRVRDGVAALDIQDEACEDVVICCLSATLSQPVYTMMILCQTAHTINGRWSAYNFREIASYETYVRRYDVITFGNAAHEKLPLSARTEPMRGIWKTFKRKENT